MRPSSLTARGTSVTSDYALAWSLITGDDWVTEVMSVRARGDGWEKSLELRRDDDSEWLDCDLALCPFTNTMPVLRHNLVAAAQHGHATSVDFVMAWIDVPDLTVERSLQHYTALGPAADGGALIRFESEDFEATIEFDRNGLVRHYPDLATRLSLGERSAARSTYFHPDR